MSIAVMLRAACAPVVLLLVLALPSAAADVVFLAVDRNLFADSRFIGWQMERSIMVSDGSCQGEYEREGTWTSVDVPYVQDDIREVITFVRHHKIDPATIVPSDVPRYRRIQVHITTADYTDHGLYFIAADADLPGLIQSVTLRAVAKR